MKHVSIKQAKDTLPALVREVLAVCEVEGLRLVTCDRNLLDHPLAWGGASA